MGGALVCGGFAVLCDDRGLGSDPLRLVKSDCIREELLEVMGQLESLDAGPWWEDFDNEES